MVTVPSRQAGNTGSQSLSRQLHPVGFCYTWRVEKWYLISSKPQLLILSTRPCTIYTTLPTYSITLLLTEHTPDIPLPVPKTGHFSFSPLGLHMGASQVALMVKNLPASAGDLRDMGLIPESGRSPGGGNGNPFQFSCLKNPMDRGAWQAQSIGYHSQKWLKQFSMYASPRTPFPGLNLPPPDFHFSVRPCWPPSFKFWVHWSIPHQHTYLITLWQLLFFQRF